MQKHANLVDLVKSFPTNIFLQNLTSIQQRTSPVNFAHLAEQSGKGSVSNLSTKVPVPRAAPPASPTGRRLDFDEGRGDSSPGYDEMLGVRESIEATVAALRAMPGVRVSRVDEATL